MTRKQFFRIGGLLAFFGAVVYAILRFFEGSSITKTLNPSPPARPQWFEE